MPEIVLKVIKKYIGEKWGLPSLFSERFNQAHFKQLINTKYKINNEKNHYKSKINKYIYGQLRSEQFIANDQGVKHLITQNMLI